MTELVKVADIDKTHKNPIAELVQIAAGGSVAGVVNPHYCY